MKLFARTHLRDDSGVALVVVMGVIALLSVLAVGGFALASQSVHSTDRLQTEEKAFQAASSGLDRVLATFNTSNFSQGQSTFQVSGTTPDGAYLVTVGKDPLVSYRYSIICTGTVGSETARVRQDFYFLDLWAVNIGQGENPGRPPGAAGDFNGGPDIHGPFFISGGSFNSNPDFYDGPLFVNSDVEFMGGTTFIPESVNTKYVIYAGGTCSGYDPTKVTVQFSCPQLELPWVEETYKAAMLEAATDQSSDNLRGDGDPATAITEVTTLGSPSTYMGVRYEPLATGPYKVIEGPLTITGASPSFGVRTVGSLTEHDDFAFDTVTNTLYVEGAVYVKGNVVIGSGVSRYQGSGVIVSEGDVTAQTGDMLQPLGGGVGANDMSNTNSLGFICTNFFLGDYSGFEGTVFANGDFILGKAAIFQGAVHANTISNPEPPKGQLWMEMDMRAEKLPDGMPGSSTDPRGNNYGGGVVIPGTWSRAQ